MNQYPVKKKKYLFLFLLSVPFLSYGAYGKRTEKKTRGQQRTYAGSKRNVLVKYTLYVKGVECKLCAQSIIDLLDSLEGIEQTTVTMVGLDYTNCYFQFIWNKKDENIPVTKLKQCIEKEGFSLDSVEGQFTGLFERSSSGSITWVIQPNLTVTVENLPQKTVEKKLITEKGKLIYNDEKKEFNYEKII